MKDLGALISGLDLEPGPGCAGMGSVRVCDVTEDSRTCVPGSLFVARSGTRVSGSGFVDEAIRGGAVGVVTDDRTMGDVGVPVVFADDAALAGARIGERFYGDPSSDLLIGAITGTNGKTTVAHFVHQIMNRAGVRCGLIGTVEVDDGRERCASSMTTPPGIELSRTLSTMIEHGCAACVMEASSHALDQSRLGAINVDVGGFTNLSGDHLDYHGDLGSYARAKARLFRDLAPGSVGVVHADDGRAGMMIDSCAEGVRVVRVGLGEGADLRGRIEGSAPEGMDLRIEGSMGRFGVRVPVFGEYNAINIVVALGMCEVLLERSGMDEGARRGVYVDALSRARLPKGRMERVDSDEDDVRVLVDFAHTDDALAHALGGARSSMDGGALWCVFGCGGDKDRTKRPRMGAVAARGADRVVVTSDNPRSEKPGAIIDEVLSGIDPSDRDRVEVHADRGSAIDSAVRGAAPGDTIVIAGKGHETGQVISGADGGLVTIGFDDALRARAALGDRRGAGVGGGA